MARATARAQRSQAIAHPVAQRLADSKHHLKDRDHHGEKDQRPQDAVQQHGVEPARPQR